MCLSSIAGPKCVCWPSVEKLIATKASIDQLERVVRAESLNLVIEINLNSHKYNWAQIFVLVDWL